MKGYLGRRRRLSRSRLSWLAGLAIVIAAGLAAVGVGTAATVAKPEGTSPPTIGGTAKVGGTLTANTGAWSGGSVTLDYQWVRCDQDGGSCSNISGATEKTYTLKNVDKDNTLRVQVTATNADGSTSATSVPTAVVGVAETTPTPSSGGCPMARDTAVAVSEISAPARLAIDQFQLTSGRITKTTQSISVRFHVGSTCGNPVKGANLLILAVPFNQFSPGRVTTGDDGWATVAMNRMRGFPAAQRQQLLVLFARATKPGEPGLGGVSTRRLVSVPVS